MIMSNNSTRQISKFLKNLIRNVGPFFQIYIFSFLFTGIIVPIIASAITAVIYVITAGTELESKGQITFASSRNSLQTGVWTTLIVWLIIGLFYYYFATVKGANAHSYGLLQNRLEELKARMKELETHPTGKSYLRTCEYHDKLEKLLNERNIQWVLGTGYIAAWNLVHQADAALMKFESDEDVLGDALYIKWSIQNSQINQSQDLLNTINIAVQEFTPDAVKEGYFDSTNKQSLNPPTDPQKERARSALCEVRNALNIFRDDNWEGLVNSRKQLLLTAIVTGLITYFILIIAIISRVDPQSLVTVMTDYIIGALAGLFLRLIIEAGISKAVDDYGLAVARIITTPLLCGLAGIGGVLVTVIFYNSLLGTPALPVNTPASGVTATVTTTTVTPNASGQIEQPQGAFFLSHTLAVTPTSTPSGISTPTSTVTSTPGPTSTSSPTPMPSPSPSPTSTIIRPCTEANKNDQNCLTLSDVFFLDPRFLLAAAVFGLTPNLLVQTLQGRATQYVSNIQSSQPQNQSSNTNP
jgi:hypothetical protein